MHLRYVNLGSDTQLERGLIRKPCERLAFYFYSTNEFCFEYWVLVISDYKYAAQALSVKTAKFN